MESFHINSLIFLHLLLISFYLIFEFFSINCNALGQCLQTESLVLLQLKRGFTSGDLDTWQLSTNCCIWEGVTCDELSGRVIGLDLSVRSIAGMIDPSLFNLTSLRALDFSHNQFHGISIPNYGWDRLANLSSLDLSDAGFTGKIPVGIFRLKKLTFLDLSFYNNIGSLSLNIKPTFLRNMSSLKELGLNFVDLSPFENEWCGALTNFTHALEVLEMIHCSLSHASCSSLSMLPYLYKSDLTGNNLDSNIFYSFVNFTSLSSLIVRENQFKGVFPKQIFLLKNLQYLDISDNPMLSGSLPEFSEDSKLLTLSLHDTNFFGNLPNTIGNLKFLQILDLFGCQFSGRIPPSIGNLSQLFVLDLSGNKFSGDFEFEFIKDLKNLEILVLSNNGLSLNSWDAYNGSFLSSFPKIFYLAVVSCNLTKIPTTINYPHKLISLDLSNNKIHGEIPSWFWRIPSLNLSCNMFTHVADHPLNLTMYYNHSAYIDLHSNMLEGPIPPLPLTKYSLLDFSNNHLTFFISFNIASHQNSLKYLLLANNSLTGEIPPFICNMTNLVVLDLSNNKLTGSIPSCLLKGVYLQALKIRGNQLHGAIPNEISPKCELQIIDLRDNQLDELIPRSLSNCKSLEILDLGNNNLKDTFPYWLGNMSSLRVLVLRSNKFQGKVRPFEGNLERNYAFSMLHVLDISSNNFSGKLCAKCFNNFKSMMIDKIDRTQDVTTTYFNGQYYYFGLLTIMNKAQQMTVQKFWMIFKSIDFSNNLFEGEIPITIGQLTSLQVLNMSHNCLTGKIISQLGNLSHLESLDLSMNSLSDKIPQELASLDFLAYLNLSYNKLVGNIPVGGQFCTFTSTSFEGNNGLRLLPCNTLVPRVNNTTILSDLRNQAPKNRRYMIILGILFGVGFGGSMAIVVVLDVMCCDRSTRRRSRISFDG